MKQRLKSSMKKARLLYQNPRGVWKQLRPHILRAKSGPILVNGITFNVDLDLDSSMYWMYHHHYQPSVVNVLKRYLREGDTFVDVGAHVGYVSAFGLGLVGKTGSVHAFESVPEYFARLQVVQQENPEYDLTVNCEALGDRKGTAKINVHRYNARANTMVADRMPEERRKDVVDINVTTLTDYLLENNVENPRLVKIDVEGYEFPVIKGFEPYLRAADMLPVLVVEISPQDSRKLGVTMSEFAAFISELGYVARSPDCTIEIQLEELTKVMDLVLLPKAMVQ